MSSVKQCDKCGKVLKDESVMQLTVNVWGKGGTYVSERTYDLCMSCGKAFEKFLTEDSRDDAE